MSSEKIKNVVLLLLLIIAIVVVQGQQANMTEEDIIAEAQLLFDLEKWQEALPLFAQLVSVHPEKPEYNYKFGVCTLLGNRTDRRRPIRYLSKAYKSMADNPDLLFYLGMSYYQNQEFTNAMKFLNLYLAKLDPNSPKRAQILEQINACLNGMNLEHKNLVNEIISKTEFQTDNFHRAYRADELNGSLILKPENFVTSKEKNSGINSFVFISEPRGTLYFSGYDNKNSIQQDIYKVILKDNGNWDTPVPISNKVNTNFDEAYPVVTDNGATLYFSSKGHNSLGGYDIFKSTLDPETKEFGQPENMGIGINSPFDDILFIPDNSGSGAFFASNRDNLGDGINVFRIKLNNEAFGDQQILAQNSIQTKLDNVTDKESSLNSESKSNPADLKQEVAQNKAPLDPQQKPADLVQQRVYVNKLADTAYLLISNMKSLIRDLTNKRDRANMISRNKLDKAKKLEVEFENIISGLPNAVSKEEFENELANAVKNKEDIYQFRQSADQANLIARSLGKHIKVKNAELKQLKLDAGKVQTHSLSGDFNETQMVYSVLMESYMEADTLTDFSQNINWINLGKIKFSIPDSEIVFAKDMREGYENQTLLAMAKSKQVSNSTKIDKSIPIRIVDNRKPAQEAVKPAVVVIKQVEHVLFHETAVAEVDEQFLEINFTNDWIEAEPLVHQIAFDETAYAASMGDETLEINNFIDRIEPANVIQPVIFNETAYALSLGDENLEIGNFVDRIEPANVIQPVIFNETAYALSLGDENLEIGNFVDRIEPANVIQPVTFNETAYALSLGDENLEVGNFVDRIEPANVIQPVTFNETAYALSLGDENLEVGNFVDRIEPAKVIQPVIFNETAYALSLGDENLEIGNFIDRIEPANVIQHVTFNENAYALSLGDENLEIELEADHMEAIQLVNQVVYNDVAFEINTEETLEIKSYNDHVQAVKQVQPVVYTKLAMATYPEEGLEINLESLPEIIALAQVSPVLITESKEGFTFEEESLEINMEKGTVDSYKLVVPVAYPEKAMVVILQDEEIRLNFSVDKPESITPFDLVQPVEYSEVAFNFPEVDEMLDIFFTIDVEDNERLTADNYSISARDLVGLPEMPAAGTELYYLRESVSMAADIEASRTDFEILRVAIENPEDLSYEELLFAASLAPIPEDKLKIYNYAFIHIDRDWRAFNNAAVTAMNMKDLDQAEVYLYQASLISNENGKVENNMGILACYKNDFNTAETHFIAANQLGINSDYNLRLIKDLVDSKHGYSKKLKREMGNVKLNK